MSLGKFWLVPVVASSVALMACSFTEQDDVPDSGDSDSLTLVLTGPQAAPPGITTPGYTAKLTEGDDSRAVSDALITFDVDQGDIDAPVGFPGTNGGLTDDFGRLEFAFSPNATFAEPATVSIKARVSLDDGRQAEASLNVVIRPDTFQFTSPSSGTTISVGQGNARGLEFQWTRESGAGAEGVGGRLQLSAAENAYFIVNGTPLEPGQPSTVDVDADSGGNFSVPVAVGANQRGQVTVSAEDTEGSERNAELILQFVDAPASLTLEAVPSAVQAAPSEDRVSTLSARVLNEIGQPSAGTDVRFRLKTRAGLSVNERVTPGGGTTDESGDVTASYEAGAEGGRAIVEACVADTPICDEREIVVSGVGSEASITLDAAPLRVPASPSAQRFSALTATVRGQDSTPQAGILVDFSLKQFAGAPEGTNETVFPSSSRTNDSGVASSEYEAGPAGGRAIVRACIATTTVCDERELLVESVGAPASITFQVDPVRVQVAPSAQRFSALSVRVRNANGVAVPDADVRFTVVQRAGSDPSQRVFPGLVTTNEAGEATAEYEAGSDVGTATIEACVAETSICERREVLVENPNVPSSISLRASPARVQAAPSGQRFSILSAQVLNQSGQAIPGLSVNFSLTQRASTDPSERIFPTVSSTGSTGEASTQYEAGPTAGTATVQACAAGTSICDQREVLIE